MTKYQLIQEELKNNQKTWLITGVAGFIGSNLLETLLVLNQKVIGLDNFETGHKHNIDQAIEAVNQSLESKTFGEAGSKIVVEEYLEGEEASFIVLTDGNTVIPFASSQDHKARDEGDLGPNTGGMGAYSPAPVVTKPVHEKILKEVILPTIEGLKSEGSNYC